jgi:hypothetical protein
MISERHVKVAATRHGRKYGYSAQKEWENVCGQRSCGREKIPPIKGLKGSGKSAGSLERKQDNTTNPITYPSDQATGGIENPRAMFVSSVSSAIIILTAPMCPFIAPCKHRLRSRGQSELVDVCIEKHLRTSAKKERDNPSKRMERVVPKRQDKRTGLRPTWSDRRFHGNDVAASVA